MGAMATVARMRAAHFIDPNIEYRIMKMTSNVRGMMMVSRSLGALLAGVFARPVDVIAGGQLHLPVDLPHGLLDGATQVASPHAVFDGDVALISFAVDFRGAVRDLPILQSWAKETRSPEGESRRIFAMASLVSRYCGQVAHHQVIALFSLQHLGQRVAAHGRLDGILHIRDVDPVAGRRRRSTVKFRLGCPRTRNSPRSSIPVTVRMTPTIWSTLFLRGSSDRRRRPWSPVPLSLR